jgi:hypothetical protein
MLAWLGVQEQRAAWREDAERIRRRRDVAVANTEE